MKHACRLSFPCFSDPNPNFRNFMCKKIYILFIVINKETPWFVVHVVRMQYDKRLRNHDVPCTFNSWWTHTHIKFQTTLPNGPGCI